MTVPASTPHKFINTGQERAVTFSVYAKPAFPAGQEKRLSHWRFGLLEMLAAAATQLRLHGVG